MGEQYFHDNPTSARAPRTFAIEHAGRSLRVTTDAGVFSKGGLDNGTALLLSALSADFAGRALDLGCGWGALGVCMAARWPAADIVLTDINARAVELARENLRANGLRGDVCHGDGLASVEGEFDLIAVNPPIRAGKAVVYRLLAEAAARLRDGGALYVVIRTQQGADSALAYVRGLLQDVGVVERGGGFKVIRGSKA